MGIRPTWPTAARWATSSCVASSRASCSGDLNDDGSRSRTLPKVPPSDILYIEMSCTTLPQMAQTPLAYAHVEQYCAWFCDVFCLQILHTCEYGFCRTPLRSSLFSSTRRTADDDVEPARHGSGAATVESFERQSSHTMVVAD